tara:strand:- start:3476 stop:3952 length:477 start_codon:yes stop_codon:yes gene_type:complete
MTREDLILKIKTLAQQSYNTVSDIETKAVEFDELTKFPELKKVIIDLLTSEFDNFLSSIDWVAPRPTTFRINLKNNQQFYLIYHRNSWEAQIEGKNYYLLNLPEEEKAAKAIARILRYGEKEITEPEAFEDELGAEIPGGLPGESPEEIFPEETPPEV